MVGGVEVGRRGRGGRRGRDDCRSKVRNNKKKLRITIKAKLIPDTHV